MDVIPGFHFLSPQKIISIFRLCCYTIKCEKVSVAGHSLNAYLYIFLACQSVSKFIASYRDKINAQMDFTST